MAAGWVRRVTFSFLGLLAGNASFSLLYLGYTAVSCWLAGAPIYNALYVLGMQFIYFVFSVVGWILVGVPFAIAMPPRRLVGFHPLITVLIGAVAGALSLLFLFMTGLRKGFTDIGGAAPYFIFAAIIGGSAVYAYRLLLLRFENSSMQTEQKQVTS